MYRFVLPKPNEILGIIGSTQIGKTTLLKMYSGGICFNYGDHSSKNRWLDVIGAMKGDMKNYFHSVYY